MNAPHRSPRIRAARFLGSALAVVLASAAALVAAPAAFAADDDVSWTVRTASNDLGSDRTNYSYTLDPGASITDGLVVANHGDEDLTLKVYASDGFTSEDGQLSLRLAGEDSVAVGAWIVAASGDVIVPAGQTVTVPLTVTIPQNATPGDYVGGVVTSLTVPDAATGVNVDRRLGIRVGLRVGGELAPALAVEDMSVSWAGGLNPFSGADATLTYTLHNTGNATITPDVAAKITGIFGWFPFDVPSAGDAVPVLPGESRTQSVSVPGVPPLLALLGTVSVTPLITDASGSTSPIAVVEATAVGAAVPWTALVVLVLLAAAVYLLLRGRRRRRVADQEKADARVNEAVEKALEAERAKVSAAS